MKHLVLTSTSAIKVEATKQVFRDWEIITIKTPTVIEQPFGYEQTRTCAVTRRNYVFETLGIKTLPIISIESGLSYKFKNGVEEWFDFSVGEFFLNGSTDLVVSPHLKIPEQYHKHILEAQDRGFGSTTFGQVLSEELHISQDMWHSALCGISRKDLIVRALEDIELRGYPPEWLEDQ
jgi:non-canonical (house-cleaning) NTP pyrophosphatase